jgi:hypothetical protein
MRRAAARRDKIRRQRTEASRRFRMRNKQGLKVYRLLLLDSDIEEMLVRQGLLAPGLDYDQRAIEAALTEFVADLARKSTKMPPFSKMHFDIDPETGV